MSAGLNDSPRFIQALGQIVHDALGEPVRSLIPIRDAGSMLAAPEYAAAAGLD
jgi:hypothetical protein